MAAATVAQTRKRVSLARSRTTFSSRTRGRSRRGRARPDGRDAARAERARRGVESLDRHGPERVERHAVHAANAAAGIDHRLGAEHRSAGAVDENGQRDDARAGLGHGIQRLGHRTAGGEDVVDDEDAILRTGPHLVATESASRPTVIALGERRARAQLPRDLVREDHAARRRTDDDVDAGVPHSLDDAGTEALGESRMLEDAELLEIASGVTTGRKDEVPIEKGTGVAEDALDVIGSEHDPASILAAMKIIDVTLTLRPDMPTWPGEPGPEISPHSRIADGKAANVSILRFGDHTGTHVDPPLHMLEGTKGVDELHLDATGGPCRVLRYDGDSHIDAGWIAAQRLDRSVTRVLFRTRNSELWRTPARPFEKGFIALDASAGEALAAS